MKVLGEELIPVPFSKHRSTTDWPEIESRPPLLPDWQITTSAMAWALSEV
jgi:hypothetical protein